jgi:hypothetical protein
VRTWYDQSQTGGTGSGNDAVQTTHANQPTIYTGGAIYKIEGRPAVKGLGTNGKLDFTTVSHTGNFSHYFVNTIQFPKMPYGGPSGNYYYQNSATQVRYQTSGTTETFSGYNFDTEQRVLTSANRGKTAGNLEVSIDGVENATAQPSTDTFDVSMLYAGNGGGFWYQGYIQEFLLYDSSKSASDQNSIEENIGDYFTQNTPLLDTYSGAAAAYSLRKLRTAYTGSAVEVYNGSSYADIGFNVFGELDTVALAAHCGSNNGFVSKWYDQSGNTNTATQTTTANMPKIYDGTTGVVTQNNKPAFEFDGSNDVLLSGLGWTTTDKTIHIVAKPTATNNYLFGILNDSGGSRARFYLFDQAGANQGRFIIGNPAVSNEIATTQTQQLYYMDYASSNHAFDFAVNGNAVNSATGNAINPSGVGYMIGGINNGDDTAFNTGAGLFQEVIIYDSDQSSNRTNIEDNINTFYDIY